MLKGFGTITCLALAAFFVACGEGDFDQRTRADVNELRDGAFDFLNSNPGTGSGKIRGDTSNGGPIAFARINAHPVNLDGTIDFDPDNALGDSASAGVIGNFEVTLRREYSGPIIVSARSAFIGGQGTSYHSPARSESQPRFDLGGEDELLGYVLDYPYIENAVVISPLSTLVVERAIFLGGISSGNLALASRQIGHVFGLVDARERRPDNIVDEDFFETEFIAIDLGMALISQLAKEANVPDASVWKALRLDVRDDGELNGSAGLIAGSETNLPDFSAANYLGDHLLNPYLDRNNDDNRLGLNDLHFTNSATLSAHLDTLNTARTVNDPILEIDDLVVERTTIELQAGQMTSLGVRGFQLVNGQYLMLFSTDGASIAQVDYSSDDLAIALFPENGYVAAPLGAVVGSETQVHVRVRPDGVHLSGAFDETVSITIRIVATP